MAPFLTDCDTKKVSNIETDTFFQSNENDSRISGARSNLTGGKRGCFSRPLSF